MVSGGAGSQWQRPCVVPLRIRRPRRGARAVAMLPARSGRCDSTASTPGSPVRWWRRSQGAGPPALIMVIALAGWALQARLFAAPLFLDVLQGFIGASLEGITRTAWEQEAKACHHHKEPQQLHGQGFLVSGMVRSQRFFSSPSGRAVRQAADEGHTGVSRTIAQRLFHSASACAVRSSRVTACTPHRSAGTAPEWGSPGQCRCRGPEPSRPGWRYTAPWSTRALTRPTCMRPKPCAHRWRASAIQGAAEVLCCCRLPSQPRWLSPATRPGRALRRGPAAGRAGWPRARRCGGGGLPVARGGAGGCAEHGVGAVGGGKGRVIFLYSSTPDGVTAAPPASAWPPCRPQYSVASWPGWYGPRVPARPGGSPRPERLCARRA
jgi:hypothetical protein